MRVWIIGAYLLFIGSLYGVNEKQTHNGNVKSPLEFTLDPLQANKNTKNICSDTKSYESNPPVFEPKSPSSPIKHHLKVYMGGGAGYARIKPVETYARDLVEGDFAEFIDAVLTSLGGNTTVEDRSGGLGYRGYFGALYEITPYLGLGVEGGFSGYPRNKLHILTTTHTSIAGGGPLVILDLRIKSWGYGVDLLAAAEFCVFDHFILALLPGFQFARQKNLVNQDFRQTSSNVHSSDAIKTVTNHLVPEIVLKAGADYYFFQWLISYQHVFSTYQNLNSKTIGSRDLVTVDFVFKF